MPSLRATGLEEHYLTMAGTTDDGLWDLLQPELAAADRGAHSNTGASGPGAAKICCFQQNQ